MPSPDGLLYSKEHEWVKVDGEMATVGITDYAQQSLGDIVYVELPRVGQTVRQFSSIGVIESVKAVSDLFTPISGEVTEVNPALDADPALLNRDAFGDGWLYRLRLSDKQESQALLDPAAYEKVIAK
ncbi:MAG: glycine cleavage system protein GcvH [Candidatus Eremiobacteraeota bacterium]|nr:glycine cleavage system protein GcvH [Candidatus Eremiobacteraeota bacterium]MBC5802182.1 glycine cleavage system protein GcvH [Candidatus Eremiobacteraeota bacterium]MBC5821555.1 glycine cleavage system protein GcvH [Candidatus Eremiobacteraeota bacterium]